MACTPEGAHACPQPPHPAGRSATSGGRSPPASLPAGRVRGGQHRDPVGGRHSPEGRRGAGRRNYLGEPPPSALLRRRSARTPVTTTPVTATVAARLRAGRKMGADGPAAAAAQACRSALRHGAGRKTGAGGPAALP